MELQLQIQNNVNKRSEIDAKTVELLDILDDVSLSDFEQGLHPEK